MTVRPGLGFMVMLINGFQHILEEETRLLLENLSLSLCRRNAAHGQRDGRMNECLLERKREEMGIHS